MNIIKYIFHPHLWSMVSMDTYNIYDYDDDVIFEITPSGTVKSLVLKCDVCGIEKTIIFDKKTF